MIEFFKFLLSWFVRFNTVSFVVNLCHVVFIFSRVEHLLKFLEDLVSGKQRCDKKWTHFGVDKDRIVDEHYRLLLNAYDVSLRYDDFGLAEKKISLIEHRFKTKHAR